MIMFVLFFSIYFYGANRRQDKNNEVLEGTVRVSCCCSVTKSLYRVGKLPIYILVDWNIGRHLVGSICVTGPSRALEKSSNRVHDFPSIQGVHPENGRIL